MTGRGDGRPPLPLSLRADGDRWVSVRAQRTVLGVVHNVTSATRLLDLLAVFAGDPRVETVFTCTGSSAFDAGTAEFLTARGMVQVPWAQAKAGKFDVAIATSRGGDLHGLRTPLIGAPHGAGYGKRLAPEGGDGPAVSFGLSPEWLVHDGEVVPSAIVLSHEEQRERLAASCPQAVPRSVVAGDPCCDQLQASAPFRADYRRALGVRPGQRLVVVSSTWGGGSVLSDGDPDRAVLRRALAELPLDEYRVLAAVHPNAWYGHGAWQMQSWLAPLVEHGLILPVPDSQTWKAALLAADRLLGDHGSLTLYGVSLGVPAVLGAFAEAKVAVPSPMARLGELLPRLSPHTGVQAQLEDAAARQPGDAELQDVREALTSHPGRSAALLRQLFYGWLELPEPERPAVPSLVPLPAGTVGRALPAEPPVFAATGLRDGVAHLRRFPAALQRRTAGRHLAGAHLLADVDHPDTEWVGSADVLTVPVGRPLRTAGADAWGAVFRRYPGLALLAIEQDAGGALLVLRDGRRLRAVWAGERPWWATAAAAASVVHDHVMAVPGPAGADPVRIEVWTGDGCGTGLLDVAAG
ncbi:hypothetical protein [Actinacidiphila bryophytorum]|uniref:hypothetical protein n=1 Tax=Actinacidiphila bryophytorum TaxID=1436133 RepID=UPI002176D382|nr:hypothetical protein [Actinacidiphila bryophytorum]UWE10149.1 hypothetical protein NYE86_16480 [Actinacidiphila bryophytorum]